MKLYFIRRKIFNNYGKVINYPTYDTMEALVVRAKNPKQAREFASKVCGDEGKEIWLNDELSECKFLSRDGAAGVVVRDFNAG